MRSRTWNERRTVLLVAAVLVLSAATTAIAQGPSVRLPFFELKDGNSNIVGPVVGVESGAPRVLITDPTFGNSILIKVRVDTGTGTIYLEGDENTVFYQTAGCAGNVYLTAPNSSTSSFARLAGRSYGVGIGTGGDQFVYRTNQANKVMPNPSVAAQWSGGKCTNFGGGPISSFELAPVTDIINIDNVLPPPYTIE